MTVTVIGWPLYYWEVMRMLIFEEITDLLMKENTSKAMLSRPKIERYNIISHSPTEMTVLAHFFSVPHFFTDSKVVTEIPTFTQNEYDVIMKEIVPHFEEVKILNFDEKKTISFTKIRELSKDIFIARMNNTNNLFINELHRNGNYKNAISRYESKDYKVNLEYIKKYESDELNIIWELLKKTYIRDQGSFALFTPSLSFSNDLVENDLIKSFASVCSEMKITVNITENKVVCIILE